MKYLGGALLLLAAPVVMSEGTERQLKSHQHGQANMNVVLQGDVLEIEIKTPAANILGFEHEPETDKQRQILATAVDQLEKAGDFIVLSEEADCRLASAAVESALISEDDDEHEHEHEHEHESDDEGHRSHSDFELSYQFNCQKPAVLSGFSLELFQTYPLMKQLNVQSISPDGQSYQELDADNKWINL